MTDKAALTLFIFIAAIFLLVIAAGDAQDPSTPTATTVVTND